MSERARQVHEAIEAYQRTVQAWTRQNASKQTRPYSVLEIAKLAIADAVLDGLGIATVPPGAPPGRTRGRR